MRARRRPGHVRHESADVRNWPLITANGIIAAALAAGAAAVIWGAQYPSVITAVHGHLTVIGGISGRDARDAGRWAILGALTAWASGTIGYSLCLYGRKFPLEMKVDEVAAEVAEMGDGLGRIESALTDAVAGEVQERGARHRRERDRWLHSVR